MIDTTQALWDLEDAASFRQSLTEQTRKIEAAQEELDLAARQWHEARTRLRQGEDAVSAWIACPDAIPPHVFLQRLRALDAAVQQAEEDVRRTHQLLTGARKKRSLLWDERRVKVRRKFESFPLEEWARRNAGPTEAPANGNAEPSLAAKVQAIEPARVPASEAGNGKRRGKAADLPAGKPQGWRVLTLEVLELHNALSERLLLASGLGTLGDLSDRLSATPEGGEVCPGIGPRLTRRLREAIDQARADDPDVPPCHAAGPGNTLCVKPRGHTGGHKWEPCVVEADLEKVLGAEAAADALAGVEVLNGQAGTDRTEGAWPLPSTVTDEQLGKSYIADRFREDQVKSSTVYPIDVDGQLWVCWGYAGAESGAHWMMLPLVPRHEWAERYPGIEPHVRPRSGRTHEEKLQLYTGVLVKVGRREYCIAPAGEGQTFRREG